MLSRAIVVEQIGSFQLQEQDLPELAPDEVRLEVEVAGLCRTDLKLIRVGHRDLVLPRVPGEEVVGSVCETGAAVSGITLGARYYVYPGLWCGHCAACRRGHENLCDSMRILGFHRDGGFAQYVTVPAQCLIPVPPGLSSGEAVFAEPLSCALNGLELAGVQADLAVGIWGGGPAGALLSRAARAMGATATVIEPDGARRERLGGVAEAPAGRCYDACIVAVGAPEAYRAALAHLAPSGTLLIYSGLAKDAAVLPLDFNRVHYLQQRVVGAYGCCHRHGQQALSWLATGRVAVQDLISARWGLERLGEALELVANRAAMKILLDPWQRGS